MVAENDSGDIQSKRKLSKRARLVMARLQEHGQVTTRELKDIGYDHPPRAARDVREAGIPLKTIWQRSGSKRTAVYVLDTEREVEPFKRGGRRTFSKAFRTQLIQAYGSRCAVCGERYEARYLQVDHRVPYEVAGDTVGSEEQPECFMPLCGTCQRAKSWSCEHCQNWVTKDVDSCRSCYWGSPDSYEHVALHPVRRLVVSWSGSEVAQHDTLAGLAKERGIPVSELVKQLLAQALDR